MNLPGRPLNLRRKALAVMVAACYGAAGANPLAPQVIAGQAAFQQNGKVFSITNTPNAIINWQSFSIAPDEITRFIQQSADSRVLNRITGQDPSRILGALQSNGKVYLINPNGVLFGKDARIDVQGLVASSLAISDSDFLAGKNRFGGSGAVGGGTISNEGAITTPSGGQVYLIGSSVENSGVITSPQGEVVLAAGHTVQLVDSSDPSVHVVVSAPDDQALNLGQVLASGGRVGIYGALVNQRGKVSADSVVRTESGKIVLKSSGTTLLEKGSSTSAVNSAGQGGDIRLLGQRVGLMDDAQVDASGATGGGQVLIGGGYQGKDASVPNAQQTYIGERATVRSDALDNGNGGRIIAWSDNATRVYGSLSARGGAQGGDGGFIETSGHYLDMRGKADTLAQAGKGGKTGTLLLDPSDVDIIASGSDTMTLNGSVFEPAAQASSSTLLASTLDTELERTSVSVTTTNSGTAGSGTGTLTVSAPLSWSASHTLSLIAGGTLTINNSITATGATAGLSLTAAGDITQSSSGIIKVPNLTANSSAGAITLDSAANEVSTVSLTAYNAISFYAANAATTLATALTTGTSADSSIEVKSDGVLTSNNGVSAANGTVTLQGKQGIAITSNGITSQNYDITFDTDPGYAVNIGSGTSVSSNGGPIYFNTDSLTVDGSVYADTGQISVTTRTSGRPVEFGAASANASALSLTATSLSHLHTSNELYVETSGSGGTIAASGNIAMSDSSLSLVGEDNIALSGSLTVDKDLNLATTQAGDKRVTFGPSSSTHSVGDLTIRAGKLTLGSGSTVSAGTGSTLELRTENSVIIGTGTETSSTLVVSANDIMTKMGGSTLSIVANNDSGIADITLNEALSWSGNLTLYAPQNIHVTGNLAVSGTLEIDGGAWSQNSASLPTLSAGDFNLAGGTFLRVTGGDGSSSAPYQIADVYGLQGAATLSSSNYYKLVSNIDASGTSGWNGGDGFSPIGNSDAAYSGTFDGNGKSITGLTINRDYYEVGLFGALGGSAYVHDLTISGTVTGGTYAGGLAGSSAASSIISNVASSVNVAASSSGGGLVGSNGGAITNSYATGTVSGYYSGVGGLVGVNSGSLQYVYASGSVTGGAKVGGLVGWNSGTVADAYANGSVGKLSGGDVTHQYEGGFAGYNTGTISRAYSTGAVSTSFGSLMSAFAGCSSTSCGTITNAYYDSSLAGTTDSVATGLTTAQMMQSSNFSGFTFGTSTPAWRIYDGNTYPLLKSLLTSLTVDVGGTAPTQVYDKTTPSFTGSPAYTGFTGSDTSSSLSGTLGWGTAVNVGTYSLTGLYSTKYDISYTGTGASLAITARTVTPTGSKTYDRGTSLSSSGMTLSNMVPGDTLTFVGSVSFADKNVGTGKALTIVEPVLGGASAGNYTLNTAGATGSITAAALTVSGMTGVNRSYTAGTSASTTGGTLSGIISGDSVTVGTTTASFADKNVGTGKAITVSSVGLSGTDAGNYTVTNTPAGLTADITAAALSVSSLTGLGKTYDSTTTATATGGTLSGILGSDTVSIASASGSYASKGVGTSKPVTVSAVSLTGTDAGNYTVSSMPTGLTGTITAATLTVSGITGVSRTYTAGTSASTTGGTLGGVYANDVVAVGTVTAAYADKNVGTSKSITVSAVGLSGADAGNYTVTAMPTDVTGAITAATLTVSGMTGVTRVYDSSTTATTSGGALTGILGSDTVSKGAVTASFADKNVGTSKAVTVSSVALSGTDAGNYTVTIPTGLTANITAAPLTVSGMSGESRVYDRTTTATTSGGTLAGIYSGDAVAIGTVTASFASKGVGTSKPVTVSAVTLSGTDAGNYAVTTMPSGLTADITAATLTVSGITGGTRTYTAGTAATTTGGTLSGVVSGDTVSIGTVTAAYDDKNVGTGKGITVSAVGLSGTDAGNYTVTTMPTGVTGAITAATLTVSGMTGVTRVYDATTGATTSGGTLSGVLGSDTVSVGSTTASYASKNVGTSKPVTVSSVSLTGTDAGNYTVTNPTGVTGAITAAPLTLSGLTAASRAYNAGTSVTTSGGTLAGILGSDVVSKGTVTAAFADKNAGTGKAVVVSNIALTGTDAGNYAVANPTGVTADITPAALTVSGIAGVARVYDATTSVTTTGGALSGVLGSDSVALGTVTAAFTDKNVGTAKPVTVSNVALTGTDAANYTVTVPAGVTGTVTAAPLTVTGLSVPSRAYNALTAALTSGGALSGVLASDQVALGTVTAAFADAIPATGKSVTVSQVALSGTDSGNYSVTLPTGLTGAITQALQATWTGPASGQWSDSSNWSGGVVPVSNYVLNASLPGASGTVIFGSGAVTLETLTAANGQALRISGGTLTLGTSSSHVSSVAGGVTVATGGALQLAGTLAAGSYTQSGGSLGGNGTLAAQQFAMSGGAIGGLAALGVNGTYSHTGGAISIPGTATIVQTTGNLAVGPMTVATGINLSAPSGAITQTGALNTPALATASKDGVTLTQATNHILAYSGANSGSGGITLTNVLTGTDELALGPLSTAGGGITVDNTGGIHTMGVLSAPAGSVSLTAHSPITVNDTITADSIALSASSDIELTGGSSLQAVHNIGMTAGSSIQLGGALNSTSGNISATATTGGITALSGTSISSASPVTLTAVTGTVSSSAITFQGGATPVINDPATVAAAEAAAKAAADAAAQKAAADAAAKAAADAAAQKAAEDAAAKAAADAAAKKAAEDAAAKAAADAAAKAAADAAAKAAADAAAQKAAEEAAAKAAADAAAQKAAEEAAAKAAADAAAKAAADAAAKAAADAAAKAAAEEAARTAAEAAARAAAEEAAAKAAADAAAKKAAEEAAAKAAADAAAKAAADAAAKAAADAAAKAAAEAAAKAAADAAAKKAAEEAAAKASQSQSNEPVGQAINSTVNIINAAVQTVQSTTEAEIAGKAAASSSSSATSASSQSAQPAAGKDDKGSDKDEKKDGVAAQGAVVKKDETVKKLYCN